MERISRLEQETVIVFNAAEPDATVFTFNKPLIKKLKNLCERQPDSFQILKKESVGSYTFSVPKKYIKVNSPRTTTKKENAAK